MNRISDIRLELNPPLQLVPVMVTDASGVQSQAAAYEDPGAEAAPSGEGAELAPEAPVMVEVRGDQGMLTATQFGQPAARRASTRSSRSLVEDRSGLGASLHPERLSSISSGGSEEQSGISSMTRSRTDSNMRSGGTPPPYQQLQSAANSGASVEAPMAEPRPCHASSRTYGLGFLRRISFPTTPGPSSAGLAEPVLIHSASASTSSYPPMYADQEHGCFGPGDGPISMPVPEPLRHKCV